MTLTNDQKARIAEFLRAQDGNFGKLSPNARVQALAMLKSRIRTELSTLDQDSISDEQVESILKRMVVSVKPKSELSPVEESENSYLAVEPPKWKKEEPKSTSVPKPEPVSKPEPESIPESVEGEVEEEAEVDDAEVEADAEVAIESDFSERRWLGLCAALAPRLGLSPNALRGAFIVAGCLTGPFALVGYLICYFLDIARHSKDYPVADGRFASWRMVRALFITATLYGCAWLILFGAGWIFTEYLGRIAELNQFGWFTTNDQVLLNSVLIVVLPMAMLSGLPMARDWDRTMALLVNTVLALYAVVLGLGVSSALAGYFLAVLG